MKTRNVKTQKLIAWVIGPIFALLLLATVPSASASPRLAFPAPCPISPERAMDPLPSPAGLSDQTEEQIKEILKKLAEGVEGAAKGEKPTPGMGPLTDIALNIHNLGCSGIQQALHNVENALSQRKFDNETDAALNTKKIDMIKETAARVAAVCDEHYTTKEDPKRNDPPPPPSSDDPKPDPKQEANYTNIVRKCDPDGKLRDDISWNERRLEDSLLNPYSNKETIAYRRSELARLRGQLCPCLDSMLQTAKLAKDPQMEETVKDMISTYCDPPSWTAEAPKPSGNDDSKKDGSKIDQPNHPPAKTTVPASKVQTLGEGSLKSIVPGPSDSTSSTQQAFLPPIMGPGSAVVGSVYDPNASGPQEVILGTVTPDGKKSFFKIATDEAGRYATMIPAGVGILEAFKVDGNGNTTPIAHTDVVTDTTAHIANTDPVPTEQVSTQGPAITESSTVIEQKGTDPGTVTLHTTGTNPLTVKGYMDNQPMTLRAASNLSTVATVAPGTMVGPHEFTVTSEGVKSNAVKVDIATVSADPVGPMHTGSNATITFHEAGIPQEEKPMLHVEMSGAAKLANGAPSVDVPVQNGNAAVKIVGEHTGQWQARYQLIASVRSPLLFPVRLGQDVRPGDYVMMDAIVKDYLGKDWKMTGKPLEGGARIYQSGTGQHIASFEKGQVVIR